MGEDDHDALVRSGAGGDPVAIGALIERHLPGLRTYVRLHVDGGRDAPDDLVHSVCREVLQRAADFDYRGEGAFRNWLYKKAMAKICDRHRYWLAQKRCPAREDSDAFYALRATDDSPSEIAIRDEDMRRLETACAEVPDHYRQVIRLAFVVGLPRREIAAEMNRSETAVKSLLHRALARIGFLMSDPRVLKGGSTQAGS